MPKGPILVGTDGSERAERAVERAGQLAKALGVKVHIVSAYTESSDFALIARAAPADPLTQGRAEREERIRASHHVDRAQQRLSRIGAESETHVWPGDPAEALLRIAEEQGAQMILVGNRGMTGTRRVLGSVPNHVSHHAHCDVLIVATNAAED